MLRRLLNQPSYCLFVVMGDVFVFFHFLAVHLCVSSVMAERAHLCHSRSLSLFNRLLIHVYTLTCTRIHCTFSSYYHSNMSHTYNKKTGEFCNGNTGNALKVIVDLKVRQIKRRKMLDRFQRGLIRLETAVVERVNAVI